MDKDAGRGHGADRAAGVSGGTGYGWDIQGGASCVDYKKP